MMRVWSHRPQFLHLGLFIAAYVLGCGFAQSLAIVPGTGISIWPPSGLFIATLILASRHSWPWWVLGGFLAELFSNFLWFHSPLPAAFLIYTGNALEAVTGAWLVNRRRHRGPDRSATGARRAQELARCGPPLARAMDERLRPGADLSSCRRYF